MSYQTYIKTGVSLALCSLFLTGVSTASATEYQCFRASSDGGWVKTRIPQGNWSPIHDTRKWSYDAVPGGDIFRHRKGKRTVGTRCKGPGYDYGTLKIDFDGYQDWCAKYVSGTSSSIQAPICSSGYALSADKGTCTKAAVSAYWKKNRQPKGNWSPIHDTRKWSYDAVPGGDIFRHRKGNRTVGTRCKGTGFDYGTLKIDFDGYQDWCASYINGTPASTMRASCPSGHQLQVKPTGTVGSITRPPRVIDGAINHADIKPTMFKQLEMKKSDR